MNLNDPRLLSHISKALATNNIADIPLPSTLSDFYDVQQSVAAIGLGIQFAWFNDGRLDWVADAGCSSPVAACSHGAGTYSSKFPLPMVMAGIDLMVALTAAYEDCLLVRTQSMISELRMADTSSKH